MATILLSVFIDLVKVPALTEDSLLASIYGGFLMGIGLGIIFRMNATTGGTDLFAKIIHQYFPSITIAWVLFAVDFLVVLAAAVLLGPSQGLYAIVALALGAKVIDLVQEGLNTAKAFFVISDHAEAISKRIIEEMDSHPAGWKGSEMKKIDSLLVPYQIAQLKGINDIDPAAFVLVAE